MGLEGEGVEGLEGVQRGEDDGVGGVGEDECEQEDEESGEPGERLPSAQRTGGPDVLAFAKDELDESEGIVDDTEEEKDPELERPTGGTFENGGESQGEHDGNEQEQQREQKRHDTEDSEVDDGAKGEEEEGDDPEGGGARGLEGGEWRRLERFAGHGISLEQVEG